MRLSPTNLPPSCLHLANFIMTVIVFSAHTHILTLIVITLLVSFILSLAAPQAHYTSIWYKLCVTKQSTTQCNQRYISSSSSTGDACFFRAAEKKGLEMNCKDGRQSKDAHFVL